MLVSADLRIPFPRALVYATYRDKLVELLPYRPDVRGVTIQSRRDEGEKVYCVYEWHGGGEIPVAARAILSENRPVAKQAPKMLKPGSGQVFKCF